MLLKTVSFNVYVLMLKTLERELFCYFEVKDVTFPIFVYNIFSLLKSSMQVKKRSCEKST